MKVKRGYILAAIFLWWICVAFLSWYKLNPYQLLNIIGFPFLIIAPGFLTLQLLNIDEIELWGRISLIFGFSILELISVILIGNTVLPMIHIVRPLDRFSILTQINGLVIALLVSNIAYKKDFMISINKYIFSNTIKEALFAILPIGFVVSSIFGATYLNNTGNGNIILTMIILIGIFLSLLIWQSPKVDKNIISFSLFLISISLLFMTSFRGWYITGHDIQREFKVFELAKITGIWSINAYRDAYNACMSVTILPTIFTNILSIQDAYVFKVLFQIIFAIVPSIIFLLLNNYISVTLALISTIYFMAFPTFFTDMPFLNRQEIAFVFMSLMFYTIFHRKIALNKQRWLFIIFGIGMVLSHYTTTYTVLALLSFLVISEPILRWMNSALSKLKIFSQSGINLQNTKSKINFVMTTLLFILTFLWTSVLTNTASKSIVVVLISTVQTIKNNVTDDIRSTAVNYSLFSSKQIDNKTLLSDYQKKIVEAARHNAPNGTYYDESIYSKYPISLSNRVNMPISTIGRFIQSFGLNIFEFNYAMRQGSAKILQILVFIGLISVLFKKRFLDKQIDIDFLLLTGGSLVFIIAQVILPVLSTQYGVLRAFQQSMIFLNLFIVLGSLAVLIGVKDHIKVAFSSIFVILFFFSSTGVFTQLLGDYDAQLHLNNSGAYYESYYVQSADLSAVNWLSDQFINGDVPNYQTEIQSYRFQSNKSRPVRDISPLNDIYPGLIRINSYVYLGSNNVQNKRGVIYYKDSVVPYKYPVEFLDDQKNLIYNNNISRIYR